MKKFALLLSFLVLTFCSYNIFVLPGNTFARNESSNETKGNDNSDDAVASSEETSDDDDIDVEFETFIITKDPIQPYNRTIHGFNDNLYYGVLRPAHKGYGAVIPERARLSVRMFFSNLKMPMRFVNCLLQGKFKGAGTELLRFVANTTIGVGGLFDPGLDAFNLELQDEDFGQTLSKYGFGSGVFIEWPFLGPSNIRDTVGFLGDAALNPLTYILGPLENLGARVFSEVNEFSIDKGDIYENLTKPAIDPYIAIQDAYIQNRIKKIKE